MNDFLQNIYLFIFLMLSKTNDNDNLLNYFFFHLAQGWFPWNLELMIDVLVS